MNERSEGQGADSFSVTTAREGGWSNGGIPQSFSETLSGCSVVART